MEEADLQVFPDTGSDTEMLEAEGDGQACVTLSIGVRGLMGEIQGCGGDWLLCP